MDPAWAIMDEKIRTDIERAERHAPDGGRSRKRDTCLGLTAIVVSDFDGMNFNNRRWLTSYRRRYAKSAAQCDESGPRTYIRVATAEFGYGTLEIDYRLPKGPKPKPCDDTFAKATLCPKSASQPVHESWTAEQYAAFCRKYELHTGSDGGYSPANKMSFLMNTSEFVYVPRNKMPLPRHVELAKARSIIRRSQDRGTNFPEKHILVECFLPESCRSISENSDNTPIIATYLSRIIARARNDPYGFFFKGVSERVFKSADDMPSIQECAFIEPDSSVNSFHSVMEQTARLSIALRDELDFSRLSILLAKQRACHTFAFELPGHRVNDVVAGYFFVWPAPDLELVPQIGERFAIQLDDVPFRFAKSTAPRDANAHNSQQKRVITDHVVDSCIAARVASRKAGRRIEDDIYDALDKIVETRGNSDDRAKWIRSQITALLFKEGTARNSLAIPAAPTETPTAHHSRVARWVDYMFERGILHANGLCLSLTAVRVTVPSWMEPLGIVGAYVRAPTVPDWPQHQKPVPVVEFRIPCITIGSNLSENVQKVRSNRKKHIFTSRFIRTAHGGQLKAGLRALSRSGQDFAELSRTNPDAFARYIAKVRGDTISYDLTDALPLLKDFLDCADSNTSPEDPVLKAAMDSYQKFDKDQKAMYTRVRNLPFGTCIVSGVPGSGKNHVTQLLMAIIQHSTVSDGVIQGWTSTGFPAPIEPDKVKKQDSTSDRVQSASSGNLSKSSEAIPTHIELTTQEETPQSQSPCMSSHSQLLIVAPSNDMLDKIADDMSALYSKLGLEKRLCRVQTPDNAYEYMTDRMDLEDDKPIYDQEDHGEDAFETEVYLWTLSRDCFENHRVRTATGGEYAVSALVAKRIEKAAPDDELVAEIRSLQKERKDKPETFFETGITRLRELLQNVSDEEYMAADVLLATPESFYKLAVREVKLRIIAVWQDEAFRMTEPECLIGLQFARQAFVRFMTGDDKQCKPIVMSVNAHSNKNSNLVFCAQFGQQLELSLPSRMIKAGFRAHYLNINHRAHGLVSEFPSEQYCDRQMIAASHKHGLSESRRVAQFFGALTGCELPYPMMVVNMPGRMEERVGTSFINRGSIDVIMELLVLVFQTNKLCMIDPTPDQNGELISVLIVLPYKAQLMLFRRELARIPPSKLPKHKIKPGCIQAIQGMEAGLVIYDGTRDGSPGFTGDSKLHNTALTRAVLGCIAIQSKRLWRGVRSDWDPRAWDVRNLRALHNYCSERDMIVNLQPEFREWMTLKDIGKDDWTTSMASVVCAGTKLPEEYKGFSPGCLYA